ncbi:unnamed protein product [Mytilus coruscus]|uniref:Novel STAND NTPase 3 domain-containing protein n=1 Tax=Mytilus coruscus TaxID=42192 RepID=A0A6J8EKI2_MYTCO|nr:unnamed protein product [Mytilus coruscus]
MTLYLWSKSKPADLDDNQKRWLVVGICLHSIISPALRTYVVPILTVLYNELIRYQKIDTQTYLTHLKQYQPTNAYLNYEAVNNNKAMYGYQKANYDYTIKSVVDLSKLFLQPHMTHYTGFDETCDSSTLLGLIINIDKFPPVVKSDAEDVRRNIRNPWAHCDFTEWDAVKYNNSFQQMEKQVKDLSLSPNEEHQIIGEMTKWKLNGPHLLSGTTLGLELVNDIRQQTHVLAKYTKLVKNVTDNNSMRITNVQENFYILLNKFTELEKDMKRGFLEINKRSLAKEENLDTLFDFQKVEIEFWKEQEVVFVDTPVVNVISKILESEHSVLIVGEPGIGKSMLLHYVALQLQRKRDYNIIPCTGVQDILQHHKEDNRQMFVVDDICGRFTVSLSDIENWMKNEDTLKTILEKGKTKVAATCRLDIYNDKTFQKSCTVFKSNILNLSEEYSKEDKLKVCRKYLSEYYIQLLKFQNVEFTPLTCYLYSKNENFNLTDFLECPFKTYQTEWDMLMEVDRYKCCSLFLFVICNGIMKDSLFDMYKKNYIMNKSVFENISEIYRINCGTSRGKIKTVLDSMIGTYVRKTRNGYMMIHDQMFDFICSYFGNKDTMVRCILCYSDIRVFNQRIQLKSINEQHGKFTIMISEKNEKEYFERIQREVQLENLSQCLDNTQMKYEVYRTLFLKILKSIDDKLVISQIYQRKKLRLNCTHTESIETMECCSDDDNNDDDENYLTEGPFIKLCLRGYYDILQYFISKSVDIKNCDSNYTPLTAACSGGNKKIVQLLIDKGSDVNEVDGMKHAPLTTACIGGNEKMVQLLIDNGSDINKIDGMKQTPLTTACSRGNEKIIKLLIDKGSNVNQVDGMRQTPLTIACSRRNEKIVQLLINKGSDVNQVDGVRETPLTFACSEGNEKIVRLCIDKGSDVNQVDGIGKTPLTVACIEGIEKIVQLLIDKGCDVNQVDGMGQTPLTAACSGGHEKIVQLLIDKGSDVNQVVGMKQTPLTTACSGGHEKIVQLLIGKGSDVNKVDGMKQTPLTIACSRGNEKIVKLLIDKGSNVNQVDGMRQTPLTVACSRRNEKIVQLCIDKGSDVNQVDGIGQTPLTAACSEGNEEIVQLLIDKGSDFNQADGIGGDSPDSCL